MVWALFASLAVSQSASPKDDAWVQVLGKERSQFGDIPNSGLWKHSYTGQFGGTYILFRAGSSAERFYVTRSPGADRWRISKVSKIKGKIRKDWMIFVGGGNESRIKKPGPLWRYGGGGKIVGPLPKAALADLQSQVPLALYHSNVHSSFCQFIFSDGKESELMPWNAGTVTTHPGGGYSEDFSELPKTRNPYPITPEEREYVNRKR